MEGIEAIMDSASSVDDQVTVRLPTHGPLLAFGPPTGLDGGQNVGFVNDWNVDVGANVLVPADLSTNGVSSGIGSMMVVDDGAQDGVLTPPRRRSDMNSVKEQFSKFRGRKMDSSDEDCCPVDLTCYGNRDTGSEFGSLSSFDNEISKKVQGRLPPPFSIGYDRILMQKRGASLPSLTLETPSFRLSTQLVAPVARKLLLPDFEALGIDDRVEMVDCALQVNRTGEPLRSTTVNRSCDSIDPDSEDLFNSKESDDRQKQKRPVSMPRVRELAVHSLPVPRQESGN